MPKKHRFVARESSLAVLPVAVLVVAVAVVGLALLQGSRAAGNTLAVEAESGTPGGKAAPGQLAGASGNSGVIFGGGANPTPTPTPTPNPVPTGPIPSTAKLLFNATYDTLSVFSTCQMAGYNSPCSGYTGDRLTLVDAGEGHTKAGRFELRSGDSAPGAGGNRTEVRIKSEFGNVAEGDERWYEFSLKFDDSFKNPSGGWFLVYQWHAANPDSGSPPLGINVEGNGDVVVGGDGASGGKKPIGPMQKGKWVNYVLHVKFSQSSGNSVIDAWENGVQKISGWKRQNMSTNSNYLKSGIYRGGDSQTAIVYHDDLRIWAP